MLWLSTIAAAQESGAPSVDVGGYVEVYGSHNFNVPENDVTNLRGFDGRADTITLSNVALDVTGQVADVTGHVVLQFGHTANTYYLAEPTHPATRGIGESDARTWRNVQQATLRWQTTERVSFDAGLFLSPVGPESMAAKDDWNFSRSHLFFGLPFYHTGVLGRVEVSEPVTLTAMLCNGWNSVTDNNRDKSVGAQVLVTRASVTVSLLYLGGVERPEGSPDGRPWRHLVDAWVQVDATDWMSFLVHGDAGHEDTDFGTSSWVAGAAYARVRPVERFFVAARGDVFREVVPSDPGGSAAAIFWPSADDGSARVASGTLTFDWRPVEDGLSLRLEGRYDAANADMFFAGDVRVDPTTGAPVLDADDQGTVTAAAIAWF